MAENNHATQAETESVMQPSSTPPEETVLKMLNEAGALEHGAPYATLLHRVAVNLASERDELLLAFDVYDAAIDKLTAERDGLLALIPSMKEVLRISDRKHDAWDAVKAGISKVEGGAAC